MYYLWQYNELLPTSQSVGPFLQPRFNTTMKGHDNKAIRCVHDNARLKQLWVLTSRTCQRNLRIIDNEVSTRSDNIICVFHVTPHTCRCVLHVKCYTCTCYMWNVTCEKCRCVLHVTSHTHTHTRTEGSNAQRVQTKNAFRNATHDRPHASFRAISTTSAEQMFSICTLKHRKIGDVRTSYTNIVTLSCLSVCLLACLFVHFPRQRVRDCISRSYCLRLRSWLRCRKVAYWKLTIHVTTIPLQSLQPNDWKQQPRVHGRLGWVLIMLWVAVCLLIHTRRGGNPKFVQDVVSAGVE